jgi:uncharacterized membrane protein
VLEQLDPDYLDIMLRLVSLIFLEVYPVSMLLQISFLKKTCRHCRSVLYLLLLLLIYLFLTAIGLTPGGSSLHTNSTQSTENGTYIIINKYWEVRAVPRLCELYPVICLTTEEKSLKNLS